MNNLLLHSLTFSCSMYMHLFPIIFNLLQNANHFIIFFLTIESINLFRIIFNLQRNASHFIIHSLTIHLPLPCLTLKISSPLGEELFPRIEHLFSFRWTTCYSHIEDPFSFRWRTCCCDRLVRVYIYFASFLIYYEVPIIS